MVRPVLAFIVGLILCYSSLTLALSVTTKNIAQRTEPLFVYGTLTNPLVRTAMCQCLVSTTPAQLTGYRKVGRNIIASSTAVVAGELMYITPTELARLDRYEQVPENYLRHRVEVAGKRVWVYSKNIP